MVNPPPMTLAQPDPAGLVSGVCDESAVPSASVKVSSIRYAAPTTQPTIVLIHSQMICLHPLPEMAYMYLRCLAERKGMGHIIPVSHCRPAPACTRHILD